MKKKLKTQIAPNLKNLNLTKIKNSNYDNSKNQIDTTQKLKREQGTAELGTNTILKQTNELCF